MRKSTIKIIAIILGVCLLGGVIGFTSGLFEVNEGKQDEYFGRKLNEDNLYTVECMDLTDSNTGNGIVVDVDEKKGGILLDGKASADTTYTVGTVTLAEGKYTLTAVDGASLSGVYVTLTYGNTTANFDFYPGNTIEIEGEAVATITIHIAEGVELDNVWVLPVIVAGDEAGDYYA